MNKITSGNEQIKCYHSHTKQDFGIGVELYGGSCLSPIISNADVYIGLERGMAQPTHAVPWKKGATVLFHIKNMQVPTNDNDFIAMLEWAAAQLDAKKSVHIGCIGGHGRTGLVMAALKYIMTSDLDAILYLRKHYCKKAVESEEQMNYLHRLFGLTRAPLVYKTFEQYHDYDFIPASKGKASNDKEIIIEYMPTNGSVW